jgi:hypothetical protein
MKTKTCECGGNLTQAFDTTANYDRCRKCGKVTKVAPTCSYCSCQATHVGRGEDADLYCRAHLSKAENETDPIPADQTT